MQVSALLAVLLLTAGIAAQSGTSACSVPPPVDEIISEIHKQQAKKKHRNGNPLPDVICLGGWCRDQSRKETPPTIPPGSSAPRHPDPASTTSAENNSSESSSKVRDECEQKFESALEAAHDVEVGDFSFQAKNYAGALMRYKDANEQKPGDAAIHVRLGKTLEKLGQIPQAVQEYNAALELKEPEIWVQEARKCLKRLEHRSHP